MANMYSLKAVIGADSSIVNKLCRWADGRDSLTKDEMARIRAYDPDADINWMGLIPAVIDAFAYGSFRADSRAFCDGCSKLNENGTFTLYFRGSDSCGPLWDFLLTTDCKVESVRVFVNEEYPEDVEELGNGPLYERKRNSKTKVREG